MRDHRMAGVGLVSTSIFQLQLLHVTQHAAGDLEPAGRRTVDHVVKTRQAVAEESSKRARHR